MAEKVLMKGNEVLAEAALRAGCRFFFGYPITPQTELAAYMSKRMPKVGGTYLQGATVHGQDLADEALLPYPNHIRHIGFLQAGGNHQRPGDFNDFSHGAFLPFLK